MRLLALSALLYGALLPRTDAGYLGEFQLTVADVFAVSGRGVIITGIVEGGPVSVEDIVCLRSSGGERRELTVRAIEVFRRELDTAEPGMAAGLLIEGIEQTDVERGDTLTATCG